MTRWLPLLAWTFALSLCASPCAWADTSGEITHLLDYIGASGCSFVRNGETSDATTARAHVERKYAYVKSRVSTTEDFIRLAATQSSTSGRPYRVLCGSGEALTGPWLAAELQRYRAQGAP